MGNWQEINNWPRQVLEIEAEQVRAAARRFLDPARRTVAFYQQTGEGDRQAVSVDRDLDEEMAP